MNEIEDTVLTLTNDSKAYKSTIRWMQQFRNGTLDYEGFRSQMRAVIQVAIPGYSLNTPNRVAVTTKIIAALFEHYYQEVYCTPFNLDDMLSEMPKWAQDHLDLKKRNCVDEFCNHKLNVNIPADIVNDQIDTYRYLLKMHITKDKNIMNDNCKATAPINAPAIEVRTLIFGRDIAHMTDDEVFTAIGKIEKQIDQLDGIGSKPQKLIDKIELLKKQVGEIVAAVDAR